MYSERLEDILNYFNINYPQELAKAKKQFFALTGEIFDDDSFYEERTTNYLEWFLFDRPFDDKLADDGQLAADDNDNKPVASESAMEHYYKNFKEKLSGDDLETVIALQNTVHSLFMVKSIKPKKHLVVLLDLAENIKYDVTERRSLVALDKADIFEARLIKRGDTTIFSTAFVYHPKDAKSFIKTKMKKMRKDQVEDFRPMMMALQKLWMQCQRYSHVSPKNIYSDDTLEKLDISLLP